MSNNTWLNHVRNFRRQNRHINSYQQLLQQARQSYNGGAPMPPMPPMPTGGEPPKSSLQSMLNSLRGGGVTADFSRSALASSATRVGGRSRRNRRKTRRSRR